MSTLVADNHMRQRMRALREKSEKTPAHPSLVVRLVVRIVERDAVDSAAHVTNRALVFAGQLIVRKTESKAFVENSSAADLDQGKFFAEKFVIRNDETVHVENMGEPHVRWRVDVVALMVERRPVNRLVYRSIV